MGSAVITPAGGSGSTSLPGSSGPAPYDPAAYGGELGYKCITLGNRRRGRSWNNRYNDFPHSVVLKKRFADGGFTYLWRAYPVVPLNRAIEFPLPHRFNNLDMSDTIEAAVMALAPWRHPVVCRDPFFLVKYENDSGYLPGPERLMVADTTT